MVRGFRSREDPDEVVRAIPVPGIAGEVKQPGEDLDVEEVVVAGADPSRAVRGRTASNSSIALANSGSVDLFSAPARAQRLTTSGCFPSTSPILPARWPHRSIQSVPGQTIPTMFE